MGGHCEPGDADLEATARREAVEESGIDGLVLLPGPVDLDIHRCSARRDIPTATSTSAGWPSPRRTPPPGRATSRRTSAGSRSTPRRPTPTRARSGWCGWPGEGHRLGVRHLTHRPADPSLAPVAKGPPGRRPRATWRSHFDRGPASHRASRHGPAGRSRPFVTLAGVTPEDFRKHGHALIDWIADYLESIERLPVASTTCSPATCAPSSPSTRRPRPSRSTPCSPTSIGSSCPA